jgi:hypothetical protein
VHVRDAVHHARVVHRVARREVVAAVDHHVVAVDERGGVGVREAPRHRLDVHVRVERGEPVARALDLGAPHVAGAVQHLPVQVAHVHLVVVDDAEVPDAGRREVERAGEPSPPAPTSSTRACRSRSCPAGPTSGRRSCRA